MFWRTFLFIIIFLAALFLHETVVAFLPNPYHLFPTIFSVALPLTHRRSPVLGFGMLSFFGVAVSFLGPYSYISFGYFLAAVIVGVTASRFFASRSPLAYFGLCFVAALGYALGMPHMLASFFLSLIAGLVGGAAAVWWFSLQHIFYRYEEK
jgi:hypothetical protein